MSAESYAEDQFKAALDNPEFVARLAALGVEAAEVRVVDQSLPIGEVLGWHARIVAVCDEDAPHGFTLARVVEVD